jgi:hypothetical protein
MGAGLRRSAGLSGWVHNSGCGPAKLAGWDLMQLVREAGLGSWLAQSSGPAVPMYADKSSNELDDACVVKLL